MLLACINACLLLAVVAWLWSSTSHSSSTVPVVPGLPVIGNVIALGRGGLAFISQCRQKFGDVFCLRLLGQRMVFVFEPRLLTMFFKAPESVISFKPAVKQFTQRVYGLPAYEFFARHEPLLATLRALLVPAELAEMGLQLLQLAQPQLQQWQQQGKVELWSKCKLLVFCAAGQVLFGKPFFKRHGLERVFEAFMTFEENFEVAASPIPHLLLPAFRRSKRQLLSMFRSSLSAGDFAGTVVAQLLEGCGLPPRLWPNLLLAVMWASQANSMPAMFWSLSLLLLNENKGYREQILEELQAAVKGQQHQLHQQQQQQPQQHKGQQQQSGIGCIDAATASAMIELAMDKRSCVSRCIAEAVRLRLHSIAVRFVAAKTLTLGLNSSRDQQQQQQEMRVPRGTVLAICPIESHHDARLYPEGAARFNPDRPGVQGLEPGTVVPGIAGMAFGGGFWRCPGRFFAEMELALLVQLVLLQLQLTPQSDTAAAAGKPADDARADSNNGPQQRGKGTSGPAQAVGEGNSLRSLPVSKKITVPGSFRHWAADVAVFGLGVGGCCQQVEQWGFSGDRQQLLPRANLLRLVGFKVPAEAWWVKVAAAAGTEGGTGTEGCTGHAPAMTDQRGC